MGTNSSPTGILLMPLDLLLLKSELFRELTELDRAKVASLCIKKTLSRQARLFVEGQKGETVYLLAEGRIQLTKTTPDGREVVIKTVEPGETFAEVVLFERDEYPVTAVSLGKSVVYGILRQDLQRLLEGRDFRAHFIGSLLRRMRYLAEQILVASALDVEARFFSFLRSQYGDKKEYTISLSKKDMAAAIGTTPESLSRLIARLKKRRMISWTRGCIRLLPAAFKRDV